MSTEDEVFRKLRQQPYEVVLSAYQSIPIREREDLTIEERKKFFESYGWTIEEFFARRRIIIMDKYERG